MGLNCKRPRFQTRIVPRARPSRRSLLQRPATTNSKPVLAEAFAPSPWICRTWLYTSPTGATCRFVDHTGLKELYTIQTEGWDPSASDSIARDSR